MAEQKEQYTINARPKDDVSDDEGDQATKKAVANLSKEDQATWRAVDAVTQKKLDDIQQTRSTVNLDPDGVDTLIAAMRDLSPGFPTIEADEEKQESRQSIWDNFRAMAKDIGEWVPEFLKALAEAPIPKETKSSTAKLCRDYFKLLKRTSTELQQYRLNAGNSGTQLTDFMELIQLTEDALTRGKRIEHKNEKKKIQNEIQLAFQEGVRRIAACVGNKELAANSKQLLAAWEEMTDAIEKVADLEVEDADEYHKQMAQWMASTIGITAVIAGIVVVDTAGIALTDVAPLGGARWSGLEAAAAVTAGTAIYGFVITEFPEKFHLLTKHQRRSIETIKSGLKRISSQPRDAHIMMTSLFKEWEQFGDNAEHVAFMKVRRAKLMMAIAECVKDLKTLEENIKGTERAVDAELAVYSEKIDGPLMDLILDD